MTTARRLTTMLTVLASTLLGLAVVAAPSATAAVEITRSPWQMYVEAGPHGRLSNGFSSDQHGDVGFYVDAQVPAVDASAWQAAPDGNVIGFDGRVPGFGGGDASRLGGYPCLQAVDYTYFQTLVSVPPATTIDQFSVNFDGIDDGARISIYNTDYPSGVVVPGSYVFLGGSGTSNLADYLREGSNRVVVTQLDDCAVGNNLREASISVNSTTVQPATPPDVAVTGVAQGAEYAAGSVPAAACSVTDAQDGTVTVAPTLSPVTGPRAANGLGSQTATCTYTNSKGLTSTATATYTIVDRTAPELTVPADISVTATDPAGADVTWPAATATDAVDGTVPTTCTPASGSHFALGTTTVTCTATDASGNTATSTFTVTVSPLAGLSLTKDVDRTQAAPGETVTYTLTATNAGPSAADTVVVSDTLPAGITFASAPGCTEAAGTVTCALGTIAPGASRSVTIAATVDPVAADAGDSAHQLSATKVEAHLSVPASSAASATATCDTGYVATDGSIRIDSIDQGTGTVEDLDVLASHATADGRGWTGTLRSAATGQVQAKVEVVCVSDTSTADAGHTHPLLVTAPVTTIRSWTAGRQTMDLSCAAGRVAVAPGWTVTSGAAGLVSSQATAAGWQLVYDVPVAAAVTAEVRCLSTSLGAVAGHTHDLVLDTETRAVEVPAHATVETSLSCSADGKGIVASVRGAQGLVLLGTDPQPKSRLFRLANTTGAPITAEVSLLCLRMHAGPAQAVVALTNTATVSTSTPDQTTADDTASATFTATGGSGPVAPRPEATPGKVATVRGRQLVLNVRSTASQRVTVRMTGLSGVALASRTVRVARGTHAVTLRLSESVARSVARHRLTHARVVVRTTAGVSSARWVRLRTPR